MHIYTVLITFDNLPKVASDVMSKEFGSQLVHNSRAKLGDLGLNYSRDFGDGIFDGFFHQ